MLRSPSLSRRLLMASLVAGLTGSAVIGATPDEPRRRGRQCDASTLAGDWGLSVSGIRVVGPGATESFIGVGTRTYDGYGSFTESSSSHGQLTGATTLQLVGTYQVNADCTGTTEFTPAGSPVTVRTAVVIVDGGTEIQEIVLSPQPNLVTAVQRRID